MMKWKNRNAGYKPSRVDGTGYAVLSPRHWGHMLVTVVCMFLFWGCNNYRATKKYFNFLPMSNDLLSPGNHYPFNEEFRHEMVRNYISPIHFIDHQVLCVADSSVCNMEFRILKDSTWELKTINGWQIFYSHKDDSIRNTKFSADREFIFLQKKILLGRTLYGFRINFPSYVVSEDSVLWFDRMKGVVIISNASFSLVRSDW